MLYFFENLKDKATKKKFSDYFKVFLCYDKQAFDNEEMNIFQIAKTGERKFSHKLKISFKISLKTFFNI